MRAKRAVLGMLAGLAVLAATAGESAAQEDLRLVREGVWNRSLAAAQSAARYTGRPVLVFFFEDWCGYCEQVEKLIAAPDVREAAKRFILIKTSTEENFEFARKYKIDMHHQMVMLDWSGNLIAKVTDFTSEKDVALAIIEAAAANDLLAGRKLVELGYCTKAAERFRLVGKISRDKKTQEAAKKALDDIAERGKRQLALIKQMVRKGRTEEATDACTEFVRDFPSEAGRDEAEKLLAKLKSGKPFTLPDEKAIVEEPAPKAEPADEARKLVDKGMVYEWDHDLVGAVATYQKVTQTWPGTPAAEDAARRMKLILDDPPTRAELARQKMVRYCSRMLEMGELYERNNRDDLALTYYRSILLTYPDSDYAADALKRITEIERRHPAEK